MFKNFPEEKDQHIRVKQEEAIYKETHFKVDEFFNTSGESHKIFTDDVSQIHVSRNVGKAF